MGVRVSTLEVGKKPVFFVKIVNGGPADAEDVSVSMDVSFRDGHTTYKSDHKMVILANNHREHFIFPGFEIGPLDLNGLNKESWPLEISGHFVHKGKEVNYRYKYNPWPGDEPRPDGLPLFVPGDFQTSKAISASVTIGFSTEATCPAAGNPSEKS